MFDHQNVTRSYTYCILAHLARRAFFSIALHCVHHRARAREQVRAPYGEDEEEGEEDHSRRGATHNTPTSEGREGHDTNSRWRERERGIYKPRARAVAAWATLLVLLYGVRTEGKMFTMRKCYEVSQISRGNDLNDEPFVTVGF